MDTSEFCLRTHLCPISYTVIEMDPNICMTLALNDNVTFI